MKRLLLGLLVVVLFCGMAFAADFETGKYTKKLPSIASYQSQVTGGTVLSVTGMDKDLGDKLDKPGTDGVKKLQNILEQLKKNGFKASIAYVTFKFDSSTATYKWGELDEILFNFKNGKFYYNDYLDGVTEALIPLAVIDLTLDGTTDYEDPDRDAGVDSAIISIKGEEDDSGGCSAIQLGAIALFLLPAFALLRRSKK